MAQSALGAWFGALVLAAACAAPLIWPGDAPWINDEPTLVALALDANDAGRPATVGMEGSRGLRYGPLPVWLLQAGLLVTHNPIGLVTLRTAFFSAALGVALGLLARRLGWTVWSVVPFVVTPYFWIYARTLWDNTWLIPLGATAMALVAEWLATRRLAYLLALLANLWAMLMVHLMAVSVVAPIIGYLAFAERATIARHWRATAALAVILAGISAGYAVEARSPVAWREDGPRSMATLASPVWGPRLLSSYGLEYFLGYDWLDADESQLGALLLLCNLESLIVVPLCWGGWLMSVGRGWRLWRQKQAWTTQDRLLALAAASWTLQILLHAALAVPADPHYGNPVWIAYLLLAWFAVHLLGRQVAARNFWLVHGVICATALAMMVIRLHHTGGTRSLGYGPVLRSQWEVAAALATRLPDMPMSTNVAAWIEYPQGPKTLVRLRGGLTGQDTSKDALAVLYRDEQLDRAWLIVRRIPPANP